jgi:hypothetical protein
MDNKLDSIFGSGGRFAGLIVLAGGLFSLIGSYSSIISLLISIFIILLGALMAFSYTGAEVDLEERLYRNYNKLFGLFKYGDWYELDSYDGLKSGVNLSKSVIYSRSNRSITEGNDDYRVFLYDKKQKVMHHLKKSKSKEEAKSETAKLAMILKMKVLN